MQRVHNMDSCPWSETKSGSIHNNITQAIFKTGLFFKNIKNWIISLITQFSIFFLINIKNWKISPITQFFKKIKSWKFSPITQFLFFSKNIHVLKSGVSPCVYNPSNILEAQCKIVRRVLPDMGPCT